MTIQQAIEKAIEGGYKPGADWEMIYQSEIFLDPLFWQSLGKAMGWEEYACEWCGGTEEKPSMEGDVSLCKSCGTTLEEVELYKTWRVKWHRFIDHLAEGKDAESFFESL